MRIQEGNFLKIALNIDLTLSDDGECLALLISCGIIDLGAFCVELWSFSSAKEFRFQCPIFRFGNIHGGADPPCKPSVLGGERLVYWSGHKK